MLFCDLVDSTSLASRLDLEEFRDVIHSFQAACAAVIRRFEGTISRYMGDGILVLFGYPRAHEDDAERAVRAGLSMVEAVARLRAPVGAGEPLAIRVGIATGLVVVGDLIGEGASEEEAVLGETPNLAARLHAVASPNTVVIASGTRALLGERFVCEDLGAHQLKGFAAPVPCVARACAAVRRESLPGCGPRSAHAARRPGRRPGLAAESVAVRGAAPRARGDARGRGRHRQVAQSWRRCASASPTSRGALLRFQCSPHYVNRALHPVIQHIELRAGIGPEDTASTKLEKLSAWLGAEAEAGHALPLLAALLSIPGDDRRSRSAHERSAAEAD